MWLVGESGCGKSVLSRSIMGLLPSNAVRHGSITFEGREIGKAAGNVMKQYWGTQMAMVFQDPFGSLDPRLPVSELIAEPLRIHAVHPDEASLRARAEELLGLVGLKAEHRNRYAHEFSGGQRQRIGIARALSVRPRLIVCDEPVSALDVSIRAQILNLLEEMKRRYALTLLFIAHDLAVVKAVSDRVAVMYLGRICEIGPTEALFVAPAHPYTRLLLDAIPVPDPRVRPAEYVAFGVPPSPIAPPSGCRFRTRCPIAAERCAVEEPPLRQLDSGHWAACHFA